MHKILVAGIVKLRRQLAEWADDEPRRQLPRLPIPPGDHQSRHLALPPVLFEFPRHRRSPRSAGHHRILRGYSAVVSEVRSCAVRRHRRSSNTWSACYRSR
jgi:hypothetical protein